MRWGGEMRGAVGWEEKKGLELRIWRFAIRMRENIGYDTF